MPHALSLRLLVAALVAIVAVVVTAGPLRSELAAQGVHETRSLVAPGPLTRGEALKPLAPSLPDGGPNGAAVWVRGDRSPAAAVALLRAAGIPARVVGTFSEAS